MCIRTSCDWENAESTPRFLANPMGITMISHDKSSFFSVSLFSINYKKQTSPNKIIQELRLWHLLSKKAQGQSILYFLLGMWAPALVGSNDPKYIPCSLHLLPDIFWICTCVLLRFLHVLHWFWVWVIILEIHSLWQWSTVNCVIIASKCLGRRDCNTHISSCKRFVEFIKGSIALIFARVCRNTPAFL